jgi:alkylhydroperoxidase family enzyme
MARLPYVTRDALPEEHQDLFDVDQENPDDTHANIHQVLANDPQLFKAWGEWAWALYDACGDARERELVILGIARAEDCRYIWHQHVPIALEQGVARDDIVAIADREYTRFPAREMALLNYVVAIPRDGISDDIHARLERDFSNREITAVLFLATEYLQISRMIGALEVELEEAFVGWRLEHFTEL